MSEFLNDKNYKIKESPNNKCPVRPMPDPDEDKDNEGSEEGGDCLDGRFRRRRPRLAGAPTAEWLPARRAGRGRAKTGGGVLHACSSVRLPGDRERDMCVWAVHCGELGLRLYVCSLKWVERWPVPGMFHDVVQPQEGG